MASVTDVCNISLSHVGSGRIDGFYSNSEEEIQCELLYPLARDSLLEAHDWTFAKSRALLAVTDETYTNYDYAYIYPPNCLSARRIVNPSEVSAYAFGAEIGSDSIVGIEFMEMTSPDMLQKRILTNQASAELEFTLRITDINMMSANYINALTYWLAVQLAPPLKGDRQKMVDNFNMYLSFIGMAKGMNASVDNTPTNNDSSFVAKRRR